MHHFKTTVTTGDGIPVTNMKVQVTDQRNSTPVPISLIENGPLIRNGGTNTDADGVIEFWSPHPAGITVCGYGPTGSLVYYERVAVVQVADNLSVTNNEGSSVVNDDPNRVLDPSGWPAPPEEPEEPEEPEDPENQG